MIIHTTKGNSYKFDAVGFVEKSKYILHFTVDVSDRSK